MSYLPLKYETSSVFPQKNIAVRSDVHIMLSNGILQNKTERTSGTTAPVFELSYSRKNTMFGEVNRIPVELRPGYASLGFLGHATGYSEYDIGEEVRLYSIWVGPHAFDGFCDSVCGKKGIGFKTFQKGDYYWCSFKNDMREENIINKLDTYFANDLDNLNRLLLESCILELISINIERLICEDSSNNYIVNLSKSDIKSLNYAREILLSRLDCPPTLLELSRIIHMNDCKLKRAFKQHFGNTVYGFIREQRLEKAFSMLQQGNNVSETTFAVGYTNISHFSQAFRKRFGIYPSKMLQDK